MNHAIRLSLTLVLAGTTALATACRSTESTPPNAAAVMPCTCGDAETDFGGCLHANCAAGEINPDNPDCVCGPLDQEETQT